MQQNFTGPNLSEEIQLLFESGNADKLIVDGVLLDPNITCTDLLLITKRLLEDLYANDEKDLVSVDKSMLIKYYLKFLIPL